MKTNKRFRKIRFALNLRAKMEMPPSHLIYTMVHANVWQIFKAVSVKKYPQTNALIFYYIYDAILLSNHDII